MLYYNQKGDREMSNYRESLVNRMINIYGFENPIVVNFCRMCEMDCFSDNALRITVEVHEAYPIFED